MRLEEAEVVGQERGKSNFGFSILGHMCDCGNLMVNMMMTFVTTTRSFSTKTITVN